MLPWNALELIFSSNMSDPCHKPIPPQSESETSFNGSNGFGIDCGELFLQLSMGGDEREENSVD